MIKDRAETDMEVAVKEALERMARKNAYHLEPSPYLKTRVMATLSERKQQRSVRFWKGISILSPVASLLSLFIALTMWTPGYRASVNQNVLVRVDVEQISEQSIAFAEISLPEGVHFYSQQYPELKENKSLLLAWDKSWGKSQLPIVIQSSERGNKEIRIQFMDEQHRVVSEKKVKIRFTG